MAVSLIAIAVMAPAALNGYVDWDDQLYLRESRIAAGLTVQSIIFAFSDISSLYWHPLAWMSHAVDAELFGDSPAGRHLTSVLLHGITAGLLWAVLVRLGTGGAAAAFGALFWAVHPLRVESVAWIAERKDVLCALFVVITSGAYLAYGRSPTLIRYLAWTGSGSLALMSKPAAVSIAVLLLLMDALQPRRAGVGRLIAEKLPLLAFSVIVTALTFAGQASVGALAPVPVGARLANAVVGYMGYLGMIVWPTNLASFYPLQVGIPAVRIGSAACLLAAVTAVTIVWRRRRPYVLVGWLWFVIALLPNSGLIQSGRQAVADRFTHLPMIGIGLAIAAGIAELFRRHPHWRAPVAAAACGVLATLAVLATRQIGCWRDSESLFRHATLKQDSGWARENLAATLVRRGRLVDARHQLESAVRLEPTSSEHHNNLANVMLRLGDTKAATLEARIAFRLDPRSRAASETCGRVLLRAGEHHGALEAFATAVSLGADRSGIAVALNDAGASMASRGGFQGAELLVRKAIELEPCMVQGRRNLVLALIDQGRREEARAALAEAVRVTGDRSEYRDLRAELR